MQSTDLADISGFGGIEFSTFRLKNGATEADLFRGAEAAVAGLMSQEEGFLGHAILRGENGIYVDVMFATSQERAAEICAKWVGNPHCADYLDKIEEGSVNLGFFRRIK